ncbi:sensor histidine kinase [Hallella absiana]|uniref:sensor histidine kinase n=1 Tax=Hallella absiana TaxID=2925336 RepID=UPI0021C78B09|nr:HAMP domain-containing sensor histidine kinase [Hallella absiana]
MKTGHKISLIYSGITIGLLLIAGMVFYFFSSNYIRNLYFHYMQEKAHAVAEEKFSKDELDPVKYRNVVIRRKASIPTSKELFVNVENRDLARQVLSAYLDDEQIKQLYANQTVNFEHGQEVGTAFVYYDNTGTFAVIVLSRNPYGADISRTLRWALLFLVLVSAGVLWLISRLYAMRMLDRIDRDYQTEKMFVNNASHEINNPLTAIQGECEVGLLRDYSAQEYQDILRRIAHEAERVVTIMRELLQFSHVRSGEEMTELEPVNIASLLQSLTEGRCELDCKSDFTVSADAHLLRMAFHNLINNAIKYSDGKPVAITVSDHLVVIRDQGIGIPKDDLPHIFEPFYRASNTGSVMGHGVGLALAKAILEKHGAKVSVESQQGEGTTVCVAFR